MTLKLHFYLICLYFALYVLRLSILKLSDSLEDFCLPMGDQEHEYHGYLEHVSKT